MTAARSPQPNDILWPALPADVARLAAQRLEQIGDALAAAGLHRPQPDRLPGDHARVLATSNFVTQSCERHPAMLQDLLDSGDITSSYGTAGDDLSPGYGDDETKGDDKTQGRYEEGGIEHHTQRGFDRRVRAALEGVASEPDLRAALRRLRRREWVRIAWRDIGGLSDYDETVADLSAFADAAIGAALEHLHGGLAATYGEPIGTDGKAQKLVVMALGKLGARELNFSSDVDLIFTFPSAGETQGGRGRARSNDEFFQKLAQQLINCLSAATEDGYVFRVDMRLRPFGKSGPLVCTFGALESYYETHGRDWERYALIRARVIAGDRAGGTALLEHLTPFVYRRYLDFGTLASLREMKQMITREVTRRGLEHNVKLGAGGIREIEFTGQAFQMVRGGRTPSLRERRILVVLGRLAELGLLPRQAADELTGAYRFLRNVEHRLQQADDAQTHTVPEDGPARELLAAAIRQPSWHALDQALKRHKSNVGTHFQSILEGHEGGESESLSALGAVIAGTATDEEAALALARAGFADGAVAAAQLRACLDSPAARSTDATGRERLERLLPSVIEVAAAEGDPEPTLERILKVVVAVARRSAYLSLLYERPAALRQLAHLCR
ncbi:MAG: bifunctional [glutamate--ammonia ligase]-adenylyl-L-tyrosine phosphorylase/[glutamate--ammonia-ligase] adenylyltransferase, partial [Gammaproteobacteria bacterium]